MELPFSKYTGLGNHFIFVDNRRGIFPVEQKLVQRLCNPLYGIGADGLILVEKSKIGDFRMRIFNSDGSEAEMCGNGLRCFYKFLGELGYEGDSYVIETMHRVLTVAKDKEGVRCSLGDVPSITWGVSIDLGKESITGHFLDTGVPHFVVLCDRLDQVEVFRLGRLLRNHPYFQPHGTNVDFISLNQEKEVEIRTYERGVEGETAACGTGCAAASVIAQKIYQLPMPVRVKVSPTEFLKFHFTEQKHRVAGIEMVGESTFVFKGTIRI